MKNEGQTAVRSTLHRDDVDGVLSGAFYAPLRQSTIRPKTIGTVSEEDKPLHYKVICISMYTDDLEKLDEMVENLKNRGMTKANRSALIRHALSQVDLDKVPRGI